MEAAEGYRDVKHLSVTLRLPITSAGHEDEDLLVWTTTPWTLSSNVAAAVHPGADLPARRGPRRTPLVGERRVEGARGRRRRRCMREAHGRRARGPHLHRAVRRAARRGRRRASRHPVGRGRPTPRAPASSTSPRAAGRRTSRSSKAFDLPVIDPIDEFGVFGEGFGWQTGRVRRRHRRTGRPTSRGTSPPTSSARACSSRRSSYAHSYPHCWRCGTQLIFRLVDEWFIAMDPLREPISASTRDDDVAAAGHRPRGARARLAAKHGRLDDQQEALLRPGAADLGVRRLRRRGRSSARRTSCASAPWPAGTSSTATPRIGRGSTRSRSPARRAGVERGARPTSATRGSTPGIVGALDAAAGTPTATYWAKWYPADWISESFPGQFRNWFYALLTMSTVMTGRAPMRALFAYALLRDEHGEEMHKSQGQLDPVRRGGRADRRRRHALDVCAATNPATNLRFGYGPAHEVVRRFFLPLWNTYGFFVTYARLDGWTPDQTDGVDDARTHPRPLDPVAPRRTGRPRSARALDGYDAMRAARAIEGFVDELSNWYVRRNRRRFWKGELDADKRAAYATLHEVLTTLVPPAGADRPAPRRRDVGEPRRRGRSVAARQRAPGRRARAPSPGRSLPELEAAVELARRTVALGRTARAAVRHPDAPAAARGARQASRSRPRSASARCRTWRGADRRDASRS